MGPLNNHPIYLLCFSFKFKVQFVFETDKVRVTIIQLQPQNSKSYYNNQKSLRDWTAVSLISKLNVRGGWFTYTNLGKHNQLSKNKSQGSDEFLVTTPSNDNPEVTQYSCISTSHIIYEYIQLKNKRTYYVCSHDYFCIKPAQVTNC